MKLDKRQKFICGLVLVAVVILIWQLYSLFGGESSPISTVPKTQTITSLKEAASPTQVMQTTTQSPGKKAQLENPAATSEISEGQQQYLALVNEYQLVEIQRLIAQDQAAIASARASMAESLAKINQSGAGDAGSAGALASSIVAAGNQPGDYELIYTGQDNGEWSATLKRNGQFNDVTAGSILPDGDKVLSVDDNGVLIQEGNIKKLVTFNGVTPVSDKPQSDQSSAAPEAAALQTQFQKPPVSPKAKPVEIIKPAEIKKAVKSQPPTVALPAPVAEKPAVLPKVVATNVMPAVADKTESNFDISHANKKNYIIQIISDGDFKAVNKYVAQNGLKNKAKVLKVWRHEKPWYIAVIGDYTNSAVASRAIQNLPDAVQDQGPFVRRIEDVQSEMVK